jgi:hypothetical protein
MAVMAAPQHLETLALAVVEVHQPSGLMLLETEEVMAGMEQPLQYPVRLSRMLEVEVVEVMTMV